MPVIPTIEIPAALKPADGRFGSGPTKVRAEQVEAIYRANSGLLGTSHRQAPIRNLVAQIRSGLKNLYHLPDGYEVLLGLGGATAFWDVITFSLIQERAQTAVAGEFGAKLSSEIEGAPFLGGAEVISAEPGTGAYPRFSSEVDAYCWAHNETSTGVMVPVMRPDGARVDQLCIVDGTSAAGGTMLDPTQCDVYYFAPQKNFAADGGLWLALASPAAVERAERIAGQDRWIPAFCSFTAALENSRLDQTVNTPAIATLILLNEQIRWITAQGGLGWASERTRASSNILYGWADARDYARPFVTNLQERSQVVATIDFDSEIDAATVAAVLRSNGIVDVEPYRKLGRNQLRIATFTPIEPADVEALTRCLDYVIDRL